MAPEYPVEASQQSGSAFRVGIALVDLERLIVVPDQATHALLDGVAVLGEGVQLVYQPLRVDPAQAVLPDIELPGIIADNGQITTPAMMQQAANKSTFRGNPLMPF